MTTYKTYEEYLKAPEFLNAVNQARTLAGGVCEACREPKVTEPHHVKYCRWGEFDVAENLKMLCRSCHEMAHTCDRCGFIRLKARHIKAHTRICDSCCNA